MDARLRSIIASTNQGIGTLNEGSLHAALKPRYTRPGDELEAPLDGFVIDIRRPGLLVEIQTASFHAMGPKLDALLGAHRMLVVHPIAVETYLQRPGKKLRKSPKRQSVYQLFDELVSIPTLLDHPNLSLEVVLVSVLRVEAPDAKTRRGRRGYRTVDTQLREVLGVHRFETARDLAALLPAALPSCFTTRDLAEHARVPRPLAQRMTYCLRFLELISEVRRSRSGIHYVRA